jgi:hypothetical protein
MLTIQQCREILKTNVTDKEVEQVRDALYPLVECVLDQSFSAEGQKDSAHRGRLDIEVNHGINAV